MQNRRENMYGQSRNLWHVAHDAALRAGLRDVNVFNDICDEPLRHRGRTPRDVWTEMLHWTPTQWNSWATERAGERAEHDYRADRMDQSMPV